MDQELMGLFCVFDEKGNIRESCFCIQVSIRAPGKPGFRMMAKIHIPRRRFSNALSLP